MMTLVLAAVFGLTPPQFTVKPGDGRSAGWIPGMNPPTWSESYIPPPPEPWIKPLVEPFQDWNVKRWDLPDAPKRSAIPSFTVKPGAKTDLKPYTEVGWYTGGAFANAVEAMKRDNKPVFLLFTDPVACIPCKQLAAGALKDQTVNDALKKYVCVRIDVTSTAGRALAQTYQVTSWPTMIVYRPDGTLRGHLEGNVCPAGLFAFLDQVTVETGRSAKPQVAKPAPVYKAAGPQYNPTHTCPTCGREEYVISGYLGGRMHTHTCRYDGTTWYHGG